MIQDFKVPTTSADGFDKNDRKSEIQKSEPSFAQERLWFLDKYENEENVAYNSSFAVSVDGMLNVHAFERALDEIYRRHEVLRAYFIEEDGRPVMAVRASNSFLLKHVDLSELSEPTRSEKLEEVLRKGLGASFRLATGPLVRGYLIRLRNDSHVFLLVIHHIITDGWSNQIFRSDLSALYSAYIEGQSSALEPLPVQYSEYAAWQRGRLKDDILARKTSYWSEYLASPRSTLDLPTDRPRPAIQAFRGTTQSFSLDRELSERIRLLGRKQGVTLFMTLVAAFKTLLFRYTGEPDVIIGTPAANRLRSEYESLIGFFANTLTLRTDFSDDPTFSELVIQVRNSSLKSLEHQDMPFELLVAELSPVRDLSRNPLFQVMFALQNVPQRGLELPGLQVERFIVRGNSTKFDLTLNVFDEPAGLRGSIEFSTDLFDASTIDRMIGHFEMLLLGIVENPDEHVSRLPLISREERNVLIDEFNSTAADYPSDKNVHSLVSEQVARTPDRTAVVFETEHLSYLELEQRSNRLAHYLRDSGVAPGDLIGVCLNRSADLVVALLGILKTGAAYVPVDPDFPTRRIGYMIEDAEMHYMVTEDALCSRLSDHELHFVCLDTDKKSIELMSSDSVPLEISSESLAHVIFTSGSTGRPKGVQISHRAFVNFLTSMQSEPGFAENDVILSITTPSFDVAGLELFLPLMCGAKTVILSEKVAGDGKLLAKALDDHSATVLQATPVTWRLLVDSGWEGRPNLRMFSGGEALPKTLVESLTGKGAELWNMYGPTETTVYSSIEKIQNSADLVSIGRPIANTQMYILDNELEPVPIGVEGMLYIGGDGLADGYVSRDELTDAVFITNPFGKGRIYKTGDRAKRLYDGRLVCLGRDDTQIKLRGFRIEFGEIEHVLNQYEHIRSSAVVIREDTPGDQRLVAYIVTNSKSDTSELLLFLRDQLPEYMIPSAFVYLDELPVTPNGKVDRKALPEPDEIRPELFQSYTAPKTAIERAIAEIWSEVLRLDRVGVDDGFFDLGGHSLHAIQVQSRVREYLKKELPLKAIFEYPTIVRLARFIDTL
ncbi:MAG: amino acid adenylation domain-containing protein [Bacteroidetes bacterium]|nr:amino acid adenylation domain-containing protein [Bacteroidota bacterium]